MVRGRFWSHVAIVPKLPQGAVALPPVLLSYSQWSGESPVDQPPTSCESNATKAPPRRNISTPREGRRCVDVLPFKRVSICFLVVPSCFIIVLTQKQRQLSDRSDTKSVTPGVRKRFRRQLGGSCCLHLTACDRKQLASASMKWCQMAISQRISLRTKTGHGYTLTTTISVKILSSLGPNCSLLRFGAFPGTLHTLPNSWVPWPAVYANKDNGPKQ